MLRRRLRVGVPAHVVDLPEQMGHGRVWGRLLAELGREVRIVPGGRRADVWLADAGAGAVGAGVPVVTQLYEAPWTVPELRDQVSEAFLAHIEPRVAEAVAEAAVVLTISESAAGIIRDGLSPRRVEVAYPGVDLETFRPLPAPDLGGDYVLFAATLHPRKNLTALREAMRHLPQYRLAVVAGPAADREDSAALERELLAPLPGGIVRIERPGDEELAALMSGCAAFCLPSLWEGFGLTALEAMACGAPVVVSDRGALPEVVGDAGVIVEPTPAGIADGLRRAIGDRALAQAGRARAARFTWARTAETVLRTLRSVV